MYCAGHIANSYAVECVGANGYQLVSVWDGSDLIQIPVLPRGEVITLINLNTLFSHTCDYYTHRFYLAMFLEECVGVFYEP